jgi:hypothetical protein
MAKARSGGGINSTVVRKVGINAGSGSARVIDPRGVSQLGSAIGSKMDRTGSYSVENSALPVIKGTMPQVELGNKLATWRSRYRQNLVWARRN